MLGVVWRVGVKEREIKPMRTVIVEGPCYRSATKWDVFVNKANQPRARTNFLRAPVTETCLVGKNKTLDHEKTKNKAGCGTTLDLPLSPVAGLGKTR